MATINKIFVGMILVLIDFHINFGSTRVGFIPDFLGYIIVFLGVKEMSRFSHRFHKTKPFLIFMVVFSAILYVGNLFGGIFFHLHINGITLSVFHILGVASAFISLYISYNIVMGVKDIESTKSEELDTVIDLASDRLYFAWQLLLWLTVFFTIVMNILVAFLLPVLLFIIIIIALAFFIYFLYALSKTTKLFNQYEHQFANSEGVWTSANADEQEFSNPNADNQEFSNPNETSVENPSIITNESPTDASSHTYIENDKRED